MQKSGLASLAFYYHDFNDDKKRDLRGLLSSVLVQLCRQSDSYSDILSEFFSEHENGSHDPSDNSLMRCLKDLLELPGQAPVFLIVDALDDCPITSTISFPREKVLMLMGDLINSRLPNLRICVTSRSEVDIIFVLEPLAFHSVPLHDERGHIDDIENYIKSVVTNDRYFQRWKTEDKQLVIDVLTRRADGM
jgi:hypothetical protein